MQLSYEDARDLFKDDPRAQARALTEDDRTELYRRHLRALAAEAEDKFRAALTARRHEIGLHLAWADAQKFVENDEGSVPPTHPRFTVRCLIFLLVPLPRFPYCRLTRPPSLWHRVLSLSYYHYL